MASSITEREVAADLKEELNQYIQQGGTPFSQATVEHHSGSRYPDITLWTTYPYKAFAFWELKAPGLQEDLSVLPSKAEMVGTRYVIVWNFQNGTLYEVENGKLVELKSYPIPLMNSLEDWAVVHKRIAVVNQAKSILEDLSRLARNLSLMPYVPDKLYFTSILQNATERLVPVLQAYIFQQKRNYQVRNTLDRWTVKQGYPTGLPGLDELLARHWAYSLAVRILFYFTVRRDFPNLPNLKPFPGSQEPVADLLQEAFSKAQAVDWQAVFEKSPLDELGLPPEADPILRNLLDGFTQYDFSQLREDVIGQIMEGLIPEDERHALGQYFTREDLVDFIIGFVVHDENAFYIDPTCGSGTFLNRLYSRLRWRSTYRATHGQLLEKIWGIDIAHFPAELATINLFRQNVRELDNFPRIVVKDFFDIRPNQTLAFPPLKADAPNYNKIQVPLPAFEGIVGNFPYIRQELIERQNKGYKKKITQAIASQWLWQDPELFKFKEVKSQASKEWLKEHAQDVDVELRLSGQADIYAYLFYHAAAFLKEGGRLGIVTSNAWLDVAYGIELKRFFLRHFKIIAVVASWCEPWFQDAAINTAFTILERCEDAQARAANNVHFVKVKQPLAELLPADLILEENARWQKVDTLVSQIETADEHLSTYDSRTGQVQPLQGVQTMETDEFRIRLVPQADLAKELIEKGESAKWGLYIRAPQVYFDLLQQAGDKFVPLSEVAEVRRGYTTGINDFFYLEPLGLGEKPGTLRVKNSRAWVGEIEEACLRPVIKSPKEAKSMVVDPASLKYRLFLPPIDPKADDLEVELRMAYPLAYQYMRWGAQQRTSQGQPWPDVLSVQGRKAWWLILEKDPGKVLMPMINDKRFYVLENNEYQVDHNLFELLVSKKNLKLISAIMNSTVFAFIREISSRVNLGGGATKTEGIDWKNSIFIPDPKLIDVDKANDIILNYDVIKNRFVKPIFQEVKQKDRQALDAAVLEALGLDPKRYLPQIYQGLVEMVNERLTLPKLRLARQQKEQRASSDQVKAQVQRELLPNGLKPIGAFLPYRVEMARIALTGKPQTWSIFFTEYTLLDAEGREVGKLQGSEDQVRYVIYAALPGQYLVEIPADPIVLGQAVQRYELYLQEEAQKLHERVLQATKDFKQTDRIVKEILEEQGLPALAVSTALSG